MPLILSDLHLGLAPLEPAQLQPLVEAADELWLNGDTAETRHPRYMNRGTRLLADLENRCARAGTPLLRLAGNHDHDTDLPLHRMLADGRVLVTHGHAFLPCIAPWSVWAKEAQQRYDSHIRSLPMHERAGMQAALHAAAAASEAAWTDTTRERKLHSAAMLLRPWAVLQVLKTWAAWPELSEAFAAAHTPDARVVISGHSHRRSVHMRGTRTLMNTGSFNPPSRAAAVWVRGNQVDWIPLSLRRDRYDLPPESRWIRASV